ncbi:hypothetical protein [Methylobacterium sp. WL12]|uniref:hypothetical protein n=1 Tax=Methylobacterium sp. WL12 TaxID=2603890 RepID=UPI0011CA7C0E|nr:hypothetical protein [Methylobacterium sp. WL12]
MSINAMSRLTGWDRGTIENWLAKGCPVENPYREANEPHELDLAKVWRWHVEWSKAEALRAAAASGMDGEGGFEGWMGIREPGKAFDAQLKLMKVAEKTGLLVMHDQLANALELAMNSIRVNVMTLPEVIFREMSGFDDEKTRAWRRMALEQCRTALVSADRDIAKAMEENAGADDEPAEA